MRKSTALRAAFAIFAIAFFATPVALRSVGVTANAFENRRFAEPPRASQGWDAFQQTTRFVTDRMPLREQAVHANTKLWQTFFGMAPRYGGQVSDRALPFGGAPQSGTGAVDAAKPGGQAAQVLEGRDGWLFVKGELERACMPLAPLPSAIERWGEVVAIIRASGRRVVVMVPPDKGSIYGEQLPDGELTDCATKAKRRFWNALAAAPTGLGITQLQRPLARRKRRGGDLLYSKKDSHWTTGGALELVRSVLNRVGGRVRLKRQEIVDLGPKKYIGDLTVLRGEQTKDSRPERTIQRRARAPRVPGRTLFVDDSFGDGALPFLPLYFKDLRKLPWLGPTPAQMVTEIARADTVIFESVEREFAARGSDQGPLNGNFVRRLGRTLKRP